MKILKKYQIVNLNAVEELQITLAKIQQNLGFRFDQVYDKINQVYKNAPVSCSFMYIPILENLKFILSNPDVWEMVLSSWTKDRTLIKDIRDGSYVANNELLSSENDSIVIPLYYDDFETVNPIGSKTVIHKIGAFYFIIRNLPSFVNSSLKNIHLAALFHY